jgi:calcium binding protein 39
VHQLVGCIIQEDILYELARSIRLMPFEARKDAQVIFSHILRFKPANAKSGDPSAISYLVLQRPEIIVELCRGYNYPQSAMPCGTILRQALQHDSIAALILYDESKPGERAVQLKEVDVGRKQSGEGLFWNFFRWIDKGSFEVSADAFTTFRVSHVQGYLELIGRSTNRVKDVLTKHKQMVCQYLCANFDLFFSMYNEILIKSDSYVTKRQSIKLLGEILLDRANYPVMTAYVDRADHLQECMKLLRDGRKMIQYEAFHVFKVFVANPKKSTNVKGVLLKNREKLLRFLPRFLEDRTEDDQFTDEKSYLLRQIDDLSLDESPPPTSERVPSLSVGA